MCGRFCNATTPASVKAAFKVDFPPEMTGIRGHNAAPQWNVAPSLDIETIMASAEPGKNVLNLMQWGIAAAQNTRPLINARSETMFEKPTFRTAAHERRCLVVASGWYEWAAPKKPYYITRRDDEPMGLAGLYWQHDGQRYCVIVTTAADGALSDIHHRAPLVLEGENLARWLNPETARRDLDPMIKPTEADVFRWHPVTAEVGSTRASHEGLIAPDPQHGAHATPQFSLF